MGGGEVRMGMVRRFREGGGGCSSYLEPQDTKEKQGEGGREWE